MNPLSLVGNIGARKTQLVLNPTAIDSGWLFDQRSHIDSYLNLWSEIGLHNEGSKIELAYICTQRSRGGEAFELDKLNRFAVF